MTTMIEQTKRSRKTWTVPKYIAEELQRYASLYGKKQSQIVSLALEEFLFKKGDDSKVKQRLDALDSLVGIAPKGSLKDVELKDVLKQRTFKNA